MNEQDTSGAEAIIRFAEKRTEPQVITIETNDEEVSDFPVYIDGSGKMVGIASLIDAQRLRPRRRKGTIAVTTIGSFVELVNRDANKNSVIFANDHEKPSMTAVLNFHAPGASDGDPEFCDDRIVYEFPLSDEWKAWAKDWKVNPMAQNAFAEFIEDRLFDIGDADQVGSITADWAAKLGVKLAGPAKLAEVSRGLQIKVEETVTNKFVLASGETTLVFSTQHKNEAGEELRVPTAFHILIPILRGGLAYSIPVRLRYRIVSSKIVWFFELHRPHVFLRDAVGDAIKVVRATREAGGCGLPVIMGTPPTA